MGKSQNVNVGSYLATLRNNVNVKKEQVKARKAHEKRIVDSIIKKLGSAAKKDEAYWHKCAKCLSQDQIEHGIEIATAKKPFGIQRVRYLGGIYANMMRQL